MIEMDVLRRVDSVLRMLRKKIDETEKSISDVNQNQEIISGPLKYYYQSATEQQLQYNLTGMLVGTLADSEKAKEAVGTMTDLVIQYKQLHSAIRNTLDSLMTQGPSIYREILIDRLNACIEEADFILGMN